MKLQRWKLIALLAVPAMFALASHADAGMIPVAVSVTPDGGNFRWTYGVVVTTDVAVHTGDFFTIYDFGSLVPGSVVAPADWAISMASVGPTPLGTHPIDDPVVANLTFTFKGSTQINGQTGLGNFWAISTFGEATASEFTSITHRQVDGQVEANITATDVPLAGKNPIAETPEPATLGLCGLGLPLVGLFGWVRRRRTP